MPGTPKAGASPEAAAPVFAWHATPVDEVVKLLETDTHAGLTDAEVTRRLQEHGKNELTPPPKPGFLAKLWAQVSNVLIVILLVAAIISGALLEWAEFGLILGVVIGNVSIGILQEGKAEQAADKLKEMLAPKCTVIRNGARVSIDAALLVPGDIVFIQSGDRLPADLRLFSCTGLQVAESMLTGESLPVSKHTNPVAVKAGLGDRKCMAFSATLVQQGQGLGIVAATGDNSAIGSINALVAGEKPKPTSLQVQLELFGRMVSIATLCIGIAAFFLAWLRSNSALDEAFRASVAIAVAIIPEGLPAVVTITMALGVSEMARQKAIVRKLPAVETLGSVTTICSDKTGTLTKNAMTAVGVRTAAAYYPVKGVGYDPTNGKIMSSEGPDAAPLPEAHLARVREMLMTGLLPNDAGLSISEKTKSWIISGDPTDAAPLVLARKAGVADHVAAQKAQPRIATIPFESEHKWMAVLVAELGDPTVRTLHLKGAPERLLPRCSHQVVGDDVTTTAPVDVAFWQEQAAALSSKGLRVLALCRWTAPADWDHAQMSVPWLSQGAPFLTIVALVAILDPPREEVIDAIKECHAAGIVVKMITGDHPKTAVAIGSQLGLCPASGEVHTGPELDEMSDEKLKAVVLTCNVFARASPENKIRIVKALQSNNQICSMTGDGVNDAPSLKAANIGVAMGITGTDVSKEAAMMVLADDNFATIVVAVKQGRKVWDNLKKVFMYNLPANFAQGLAVFFAFVLGLVEAPLTPIQVLYVNMIVSVSIGGAFANELPEDGIMARPPRHKDASLVGAHVLWRTFWVTSIMVIIIIGLFEWALADKLTLGEARATAFSVLVFMSLFYGLNCRSVSEPALGKSIFRYNPSFWFSMTFVASLQVIIVYVPGINWFFSCEPLKGDAWGRIIGFSLILFFLVEIEKAVASAFVRCMAPYARWFNRNVCCCLRPKPGAAETMRFAATSTSSFGIAVAPAAQAPAGAEAEEDGSSISSPGGRSDAAPAGVKVET